jgi:hypothetical protein
MGYRGRGRLDWRGRLTKRRWRGDPMPHASEGMRHASEP